MTLADLRHGFCPTLTLCLGTALALSLPAADTKPGDEVASKEKASSDWPLSSGMTMNGTPRSSPTWKMATM